MRANWIDHILPKNCLLEHFFGGKIEKIDGKTRKKM